VGAGRPGIPAVRRGRGQEGAVAVAWGPCPERVRVGQGLVPRVGWARAMGRPGFVVVMVGLDMVVWSRPSIGAAVANGLQAVCPLRGATRRAEWGGVGPWPIPGFLGMVRALLKRRRKIGAGRGSGARALMVILG
jgi:hypothetical protein